jgi:hypothetical protein
VRVTTYAPDEKYRQKIKASIPQALPDPDIHSGSISNILTNLQKSNHLPENISPDHVDGSIKTLVKILNNIKQKEIVHKPKPPPVYNNNHADYDYDYGNDGKLKV